MKHIEKPKIDTELLESVRNAKVDDIDDLFERAIKTAVRIYQMPRDCEPSNEDIACLVLAWNQDNGHFRDALAVAGVDATSICEFEFVCCCILEALAG